jgi:hypothetical protein
VRVRNGESPPTGNRVHMCPHASQRTSLTTLHSVTESTQHSDHRTTTTHTHTHTPTHTDQLLDQCKVIARPGYTLAGAVKVGIVATAQSLQQRADEAQWTSHCTLCTWNALPQESCIISTHVIVHTRRATHQQRTGNNVSINSSWGR